MEIENSQNFFSVSITHNSKIRELSDENRVMDFPNNLFVMGPTIFELWVMETENWELSYNLKFVKKSCLGIWDERVKQEQKNSKPNQLSQRERERESKLICKYVGV